MNQSKFGQLCAAVVVFAFVAPALAADTPPPPPPPSSSTSTAQKQNQKGQDAYGSSQMLTTTAFLLNFLVPTR
jgi:hypothetical protein